MRLSLRVLDRLIDEEVDLKGRPGNINGGVWKEGISLEFG